MKYSRNDEFHDIPGRSRARFWESVARRVNRYFGRRGRRRYTDRQCEQKWRNLVRDYRVSNKINNNNNKIYLLTLVFFQNFCEWRNGSRRGEWSRAGQRYYRLFRTHFWERPGKCQE